MPDLRVPDDLRASLRRARDHADRHFAEPLTLDRLAAVATLSKFHFLRLFRAVYGQTPVAYVSERRTERAQDLLRTTNLTVTEVCYAVGFSSLGSFSARFTEITGESPSAFQTRWARVGAPPIPGCYVFMWGLAERRDSRAAHPPIASGGDRGRMVGADRDAGHLGCDRPL